MTKTATAHTGVPGPGAPSFEESDRHGGVRAAAHEATDQARGLAETGKEEATKVMSEVRSQTAHLVDEAGHKVRDRAESQVVSAARMLGDMSDELDRMAASSTSGSPLATLAVDGATAMRSVSRRLDDGGLDAAVEDLRGFARRRPVVFLIGAFAIGMIAGRLVRNTDVRSVTHEVRDHEQHPEHGMPGGGVDTGTMSRLEGGMEPALDDAFAAGAEADRPVASLQPAGSQSERSGRPS